MSRIMIEGGRRLCGELKVQGSKNATLPILAATILVAGETVLQDCPDISDVRETLYLMQQLGCKMLMEGDTIRIDASELISEDVTDKTATNSRTAVMLMGALIGRRKKATICYPGGCCIGCRPINLHLSALRSMGVVVLESSECIRCEVNRLVSTEISFPTVSVGATESVILASVLSDGVVRVRNAACEPEVCCLCDFLRKCGAKIYGDGSRNITISGVKQLYPCNYVIPADRIVCGTYLFATAATAGEVKLFGCSADELKAVISVLNEVGCKTFCEDKIIKLLAPKRLRAVPYIQTEVFPGFPTDMQSQLCSMLSQATGTSIVRETIFEGRFHVVSELRKMRANIEVSDDILIIEGTEKLRGCNVVARELRGSAALVIAGLASEGTTILDTDRYLKRGYENIVADLRQLGADIIELQE